MGERIFYPPPWQIPGLLDGRATRIVVPLKVQPIMLPGVNPNFSQLRAHRHGTDTWMLHGSREASKPFKLPFAPGDVLLAKEAWHPTVAGEVPLITYKAGLELAHITADQFDTVNNGQSGWRAAITMPQWAVRLRLRVTDVAVKRVDELTEAEMVAAGAIAWAERGEAPDPIGAAEPAYAFREMWNQQHARKPGLAFGDRPWVATAKVEKTDA